MSADDELTEPVMDGASDASARSKVDGLIRQAQHDHPDSTAALVRDLQIRAEQTDLTNPAADSEKPDTSARP